MAIAFEHHKGIAGVPPRTENPAVFVAAFNVTFLAAAALSMAAVATSAALGDRRRVSPGFENQRETHYPGLPREGRRNQPHSGRTSKE